MGRTFFLTGTEFILIGFVLGDSFLGVLNQATLSQVRPFLILGLGWVGLLAGIQLEWRALKTFAGSCYLWVIFHACWIFVAIYGTFFAILQSWFPDDSLLSLAAAVLAIAALSTAQTSLALWIQHARAEKQPAGQILQFISSVNDVIVIVLFGLLLTFYIPFETKDWIPLLSWEKFLFTISLGILMGIIFLMLFRTRLVEADKVLVLIGMILFGGGMSYLSGTSPLLVFLIAGIILANLSLRKDQTFQLLLRIERPLYLIFMMIAGAYIKVNGIILLVLTVSYCGIRFLSHGVGGRIFLTRIFESLSLPRKTTSLGWGLLSQGGMAVAVAVNFRLWLPDFSRLPILEVTFSVLLLAILLNELFSPYGLSLVVRDREKNR